MTERQTSQRRRGAAQAVGEVLANAPDLAAAAPPLLRDVCENLEWRAGALWLIDHDARQLRCFSVWSHAAVPVADFMRTTRETTFQPGVGLPGRVWAAGQAVWIEDVLRDENFPRAAVARTAGMHGAFGFPIRLGGDVLGVVEFFTDRVATPDAELLDTMSTVGNQVGQFIGRKRVETTVLNEQRRMRAILETALDALAHELRNPLAPIRTGLQLVRLAGDTPAAVERVRPMMERQIGHMVRLIDDLLDVSRITSGKIHLQRQAAALSEMLNAAVEANRAAMSLRSTCPSSTGLRRCRTARPRPSRRSG